MGIVKVKDNKHQDFYYDVLDFIFGMGRKYLPKIFLYNVYIDGHILHYPRWITKREFDAIEKRAKELAEKIKWE